MRSLVKALMTVMIAGSFGYAKDFYVAPSGNDHDPGTKEKPFATVTRARDVIRTLPSLERAQDIHVYFREGSYPLSETVVFGLEDGASDGFKIYYEAYAEERPVFTSAVLVKGWSQSDTASSDGLPAVAKGNVWVADIPAAVEGFLTMYEGEQRLDRARSKGFRPVEVEGVDAEDLLHRLHFPDGAIKNWFNLKDAEVLIIPQPWTMNILPLSSVDSTDKVAMTAISASYPLTPTRNWEESAWVENVMDFLDEPGEWVVNTRERRIYYWPESGEPGSNVMIPTLKELFRVEGKIDYEAPEDTPVKNLVFRGLTFMHGERDLWDEDHGGWGVQHDWEFFDRPTALLRFRGAERCAVEECRFASSGGTAIRLDLHCQQISITRNLIEHVGNVGILLCGYGPGTKDVNKRNSIINNLIRDVGELYWHGHGIVIWQSGDNLVSHNLIHDGPRKAVSVTGVRYDAFDRDNLGKAECSKTVRWDEIAPDALRSGNWQDVIPYLHSRDNVVEYNEIHHMMQKLGDGAALNVSGAGKGNIIRRNYIHNMSNREANGGMRTDGWQMGTQFVENVLYKSGGITRKSFNHVEGNLMIDLESPHHILFAGFPEEDDVNTTEEGSRVLRNVMYSRSEEADVQFFKEPRRHFRHSSAVRHTWSDYNLFYHAADPSRSRDELRHWQAGGTDRHSRSADPMFREIESEDFRFQPGSPAIEMGIKQLDVREMGLLSSFPARFQ